MGRELLNKVNGNLFLEYVWHKIKQLLFKKIIGRVNYVKGPFWSII